MNQLQRQFLGYLKTPLLWQKELNGLNQLELPAIEDPVLNITIPDNLRLGHLVEHFVAQEFNEHPTVKILDKNVQVNLNNLTLGEFDYFIRQDQQIVHVEVSYKFYLFDSSVGETPINHWIGPNRKDSLSAKLQKVKDKQFPLLHHPAAARQIKEAGLSEEHVIQRTYIKGQLFIPEEMNPKEIELNPKAIAGTYMRINQLDGLTESKIHLPKKHDWLTTPHTNVDWLATTTASQLIQEKLTNEQAPLIWIKNKQGKMKKAFVVWW